MIIALSKGFDQKDFYFLLGRDGSWLETIYQFCSVFETWQEYSNMFNISSVAKKANLVSCGKWKVVATWNENHGIYYFGNTGQNIRKNWLHVLDMQTNFGDSVNKSNDEVFGTQKKKKKKTNSDKKWRQNKE